MKIESTTELISVVRCKAIFDSNLHDLLKSFDIARDSAGNFIVYGEDEFVRRLYNFVASALSLVDHARRLYEKHYASTDIFDDYQSEIDTRFKNNPLHRFIQGLRNYCLHYEIPESWYEFENFHGKEPKSSFFLPCHLLEQWDGWSSSAKTFIEKARPKIDVRAVIQQYGYAVNTFYEWFFTRISEITDSA
jgi:hypothetical protein